MFSVDRDAIDGREVRMLLEARRRRITDDLRKRALRMRQHGATGFTSRRDADGDEADLDVRLVEIASATLQSIDRAIERLSSGQYGWCVRCQRRIASARLRAMPFASSCRECESARERDVAFRPAGSQGCWGLSIGHTRTPSDDDR
jgi:DnaK suppressor protein